MDDGRKSEGDLSRGRLAGASGRKETYVTEQVKRTGVPPGSNKSDMRFQTEEELRVICLAVEQRRQRESRIAKIRARRDSIAPSNASASIMRSTPDS